MKRKYKQTKSFKTMYKQLCKKNSKFLNDFLDDTKYTKTKATLIFIMVICGGALESVIK